MQFTNRRQAGQMLGRALAAGRCGTNAIVLGLARGGVPVAYEVAKALRLPLDVLIVRKLGCPTNPEVALGALASGDVVVENPEVLQYLAHPQKTLASVLARERGELARRERAYRHGKPPAQVKDLSVILVDDGAATGATMLSAVRALRARGAGEIIVGLPVASAEAVERLRDEADDTVCLRVPDEFEAVGNWYEAFPQVRDSEVISLMAGASGRNHAA